MLWGMSTKEALPKCYAVYHKNLSEGAILMIFICLRQQNFVQQWTLLKVRNWCETCENFVHIASAIGKLQYIKYLKWAFLDTLK